MLVRWVNVGDGTQRVRFRYACQQDLSKAAFANLHAQHISDLMANQVILNGMYAAFRRARAVADAAEAAFRPAALTGSGGRLARDVLARHFMRAPDNLLDAIHTTFAKTAIGLGGADVVIADCAGRDATHGQLADGYVTPKQAQYLNEVVGEFMEGTRQAGKAVRERMGLQGSAELTAIKELYDVQNLNVVQMQQFALTMGAGSIHVQFSLCLKRSVDWLARAIVHEATHKFAATGDYAYAHAAEYTTLRPEHATQNADSFAYAAMSVALGSVVWPADLEQGPPAVEARSLQDIGGLEVHFRKKKGA
jgi:hypothetical protein